MSSLDVDTEDLPESLEPAAAFALLGNETRIHILQELWRVDDRPLSFSELRRRVGVDDSAQFNYHLGKLTDHFVTKTDNGYDFRYAGEKVVRAILAGTFTDHVEMDLPVEGSCHECDGDLRAVYTDERLAVTCADCEARYGRYPFPPGGLADRSPTEVMSAFDQRVRHLHCLAADGVCPECSGRMETSFVECDGSREECATTDDFGLDVHVAHECEQCHHVVRSPVGLRLLDHSAVVSFYDDHGVELSSEPYWTLGWCVRDDTTEVLERDPWRVRVAIPLGDEILFVTMDENQRVTDVTRRSGTLEDTKGVV
ncbi:winged helix-turn-helix domain-containing protein [Halospeciosus flavus]|uniref:Helix-turn-helix domain-containing protein n=1 Tax=Halospeciosus flavus TaxID=3032283 RepID=A0ABD5Z494_9EURY|nr:winged helix-turn-helix domain-containing protein [Halospeciosus flavus]